MSWLVVLRPVRPEMAFEPTEEEGRIISDHYAYLVRRRDEGKLVVAGPSIVADDTYGIGAMTAELRPFRIAVR